MDVEDWVKIFDWHPRFCWMLYGALAGWLVSFIVLVVWQTMYSFGLFVVVAWLLLWVGTTKDKIDTAIANFYGRSSDASDMIRVKK